MIRHVVMFKFRSGVTHDQCREAMQRLSALGTKVSEVREWSVGAHIDTGRKAWDMVQISAFDDFAALGQFRAHPEHVKVRDFLSQLADWAVVDYQFDPAAEKMDDR